jgi:four helix bundle protein
MSKIEKVEDLISWQKSKDLTIEIYKITKNSAFSKDFGLCNQIQRAAVSIPSNIAEGFGRGGNKEFLQFLSIAKGSLYELKTQLIIAFEIGYINDIEYSKLKNDSEEIGKLIAGFMNYLSKSELKGVKYK